MFLWKPSTCALYLWRGLTAQRQLRQLGVRPTNPNRLQSWTGTIAGRERRPGIDNSEAVPDTWTTYAERLEQAGVNLGRGLVRR